MSRAIGFNPTEVFSGTDTRAPKLGTRFVDADGNEYVFLSVTETVANGDVGFFNGSWAYAKITTANDAANQMLAVARAAMVSGQRGWFQVWGLGLVAAAAAAAAGATLVATATAGALDDAVLTGNFAIVGLTFTSAPGGAGTFTAFMNYPQTNFIVS